MTTAAVEFRDYNTLGDPSSGAYNPQKSGIRTLLGGYETILANNIVNYGGDPTGVAANDTAFANACTALGSNSGTVYFPAGTYKFNSQQVLILAAGQTIVLAGAGTYSTVLKWPNAAGGIQINYNGPTCGAQVSDMCFVTSQAAGGDGLKLNQAGTLLGSFNQSTVSRCAFQGDDLQSANAHYWTNGLNGLGVSGINLSDSIFFGSSGNAAGVGAVFAGTGTGAQYALIPNIRGCSFFQLGIGVRMGTYLQGMTIAQCNFTNGVIGIHVPTAAVGLAQLAISDSQFDTTTDLISINSPIANFSCVNSLFYCKAGHSGIVGELVNAQIIGNQFAIVVPPGGFGIKITASFATITGNTFNSLLSALWINPSSVFSSITGNSIECASTTSTFGIIVEGAGILIVGNQINGAGTGIVLTASSSACSQQSNLITNCTIPHSDVGTSNVVGGGSA